MRVILIPASTDHQAALDVLTGRVSGMSPGVSIRGDSG